MFPAIESPAQQWAAPVDRATCLPEIHARAVRPGGEKEQWIARRPIHHHPMPVRFHVVALFRMQKKTLIAGAARGAPAARDFS